MAASKARDVAGSFGASGAPRRARLNADTSSEPEGLTRRVMLNVLEAFFRRPWLHLLPLILMVLFGATTVLSASKTYRSVGTLTAESSTLLGDLTQSNNARFAFETPASVTARNINELLRTNEFLSLVAEKAGVATADGQDAFLSEIIRTSTGAFADGDQLVRVAATSERSDLSLRLASATISSYIETVVANDVRQSTETETFFEAQVADAERALNTAQDALDAYLLEHPVDRDAERSLTEQLAVQRLQSAVDRLDNQYSAKLDQVDAARLATATARAEVEQRLRLTDPPSAPGAPEPRLRKAAMTLIVFGVLGLMLTFASVVIAAALDRTIRVPGDISAKFGLDVLAVVPETRRR